MLVFEDSDLESKSKYFLSLGDSKKSISKNNKIHTFIILISKLLSHLICKKNLE